MSDNNEVKELVKLALRTGFDVGKPLAKKALGSNTVHTLMELGVEMVADVLSSVTDNRNTKEAPKKPCNKIEAGMFDMERLKQENSEFYKKLSEKPTPQTR